MRRALGSTYTFATLEVSAEAYDEIKRKLLDAGYQHQIVESDSREGDVVDMHGIGLVRGAPRPDVHEDGPIVTTGEHDD